MNKDKYNFGTIEDVPIRSVWKSESSDFTPWLASEDGLRRLGDVLSRNLELVSTEHFVGRYRADIIAKDDNDELYVIENKFETMDHDHLGKAIVYAAGHNAKHIVIIVEAVTDEHSRAIEFLNNISNGDIDFTFIELHARKIGTSLVVPEFEVIEQPNEWRKVAAKCMMDKSTGIYYDFFTDFQKYAIRQQQFAAFVGRGSRNSLTRTHNGKGGFDLITTNHIHFFISASLDKKELHCGIHIRYKHDELCSEIEGMQDEFKTAIGNIVEGGDKNTMFYSTCKLDINDQTRWSEAYAWYCTTTMKWKDVLENIVK